MILLLAILIPLISLQAQTDSPNITSNDEIIAQKPMRPFRFKTEKACPPQAPKTPFEWLIEGRVAYFYPTASNVRELYGSGMEYSLETSVRLKKGLYAWASAGYFSKSGHTQAMDSPTALILVPIGIGLKCYFFPKDYLRLYVGIGALPGYLHIRDDSPYVIPVTHKWGCGGIAKTGALFYLYKQLYIDLFVDYAFKEHFKPIKDPALDLTYQTADLSHFSIGGGLGWQF